MSEVKRYDPDFDAQQIYEIGEVVSAADFDRVTAERDAALGRETALIDQLDAALRQVKANWDYAQFKQQRLTAADERADQQSWALLEVEAACDLAMSAMDEDERGANFVQIIAAIKEKAALKPAEGVGDDTTLEEDREDFKKVFVRINTKQGQSISLADMIARYEKKP